MSCGTGPTIRIRLGDTWPCKNCHNFFWILGVMITSTFRCRVSQDVNLEGVIFVFLEQAIKYFTEKSELNNAL